MLFYIIKYLQIKFIFLSNGKNSNLNKPEKVSTNTTLQSSNINSYNGFQTNEEKEQIEYAKRKEQIINNFINSTAMDFANKIYSTYPYSLEYANVSAYKDHFKSIFKIPRYPISEEEWEKIIIEINKKLEVFTNQIVKEDVLARNDLIARTQQNKIVSSTSFNSDEFEEDNNKGVKK